MTFSHASLDLKRCQIALLMLNFVIAVWGSEFLLRMLAAITQWLLVKGLSRTFQDRKGCKEGDAIVRSIVDFEVPDVLVCFPSFKISGWVSLIKFKT